MNEQLKRTYKSGDTEEWLDTMWTRPIGYVLARVCERMGIHPNTVTIVSMVIGALSAVGFVHGSWYYEGQTGLLYNAMGIGLLAFANFLDSTDGQLARMTGKKTQLGRILDGAAGGVWFAPIYVALVWRYHEHHSLSFEWLGIADTDRNTLIATALFFITAYVSGFGSHAPQCRLADYYRQIHLYFLKGKAGSELDNSRQQQALYDATPWQGNVMLKMFLHTYTNYTAKQEASTPHFQQLMASLQTRYGGGLEGLPQEFRDELRRKSLPLMKYTNILTFNTRAIVLYLSCLADVPLVFLLFEIVVLGALKWHMHRRHESICCGLVG